MKTKFVIFAAVAVLAAAAIYFLARTPGLSRDGEGYRLVWAEEFDTDGLPDPVSWGYEEGYVRNREEQYYTAADTSNAIVHDGKLVITARLDDNAPHRITSASINTLGKVDFSPGCRIEVSARIPTGKGSWPAIWMMGTDIVSAGWPACGEIDVMENVGFDPQRIYGTVHSVGSVNNPDPSIEKGNWLDIDKVWEDFHTYAIEWEEDYIAFYFDGDHYFTYRKPENPEYWQFSKPFYILINLAIGGSWGGEVDESIFPLEYRIDYVRYYRKD